MKTSKILLHSGKSNEEVTPIKPGAGKLLKLILVIFMLSWITLLSSCFVRGPGHGPRHGRHEVIIEHDDHNERHH